jgi:hypothetical protein
VFCSLVEAKPGQLCGTPITHGQMPLLWSVRRPRQGWP